MYSQRQESELPNLQNEHVLAQISMLQPILRKETSLDFPRRLFQNTTFMMNLGHAAKWSMDLRANDLSKKTEKLTRKPSTETAIDDIVSEVIKFSHRDGGPEQVHILSKLTHDFYQSIDWQSLHKDIFAPEFHKRALTAKKTDLLRGVEVFIEVANDRYDYVYNADILQPARRLASWILTIT